MSRMEPYAKASKAGRSELRGVAEKEGEVRAYRTIVVRVLGGTTFLVDRYAASDDLPEFRKHA